MDWYFFAQLFYWTLIFVLVVMVGYEFLRGSK